MNYTTKRKIMNSTVYIVIGLVALTVLLAAAATVISMQSRKKLPAPTVDPPVGTSQKIPPESEGPLKSPSAPLPSEDPKSKESSKKESGEKPVIDPLPVIYMPAKGSVMKGYSPELPVYSLTMNDYRTHVGIDISAPLGSGVFSIADGTVTEIEHDPMMGVCLTVDHGNGLVSYYKNLDAQLPREIEVGARVIAGQTIGAVGDSCLIELAESEHLHFELTKDGQHVDPGSYLDFGAEKS